MNITFVNPPISTGIQRTPYIPLGVGYLAKAISDYFSDEHAENIEIRVIDGAVLDSEAFWHEVHGVKTDYLLLTGSLRQVKDCETVAKIVKSQNIGVVTMMGGAGVASMYYQHLNLSFLSAVDLIVVGEAEHIIGCLIKQWGKIDFTKFEDQCLFVDGMPPVLEVRSKPDINNLGWPLRTLFDQEKYLKQWKKSTGIASINIIGSRGCPYNCSFCDKSITGSTVRCRDADDIADEMKFLSDSYSPDDIYYFDDLFAISTERVRAICKAIKSRNLKTSWSAQGRVNTFNKKMAKVLKEAGCSELYFGVESGSQKILRYFNKNITMEQIVESFSLCYEFGILPCAYIIVGVPGETKKDILETAELIKRIRPAFLSVSFLTPYPNTKLFQGLSRYVCNWDFSVWDDWERSVLKYPGEVSPTESKQIVMNAYQETISQHLPYSSESL